MDANADVRGKIKGEKEGRRKRERERERELWENMWESRKLERANEIVLLKSSFVALPSVHPFDRSSDKEIPTFVFSSGTSVASEVFQLNHSLDRKRKNK